MRSRHPLDPQQRHRLGAGQQLDQPGDGLRRRRPRLARGGDRVLHASLGAAISCRRPATARSAPTSSTWTASSTCSRRRADHRADVPVTAGGRARLRPGGHRRRPRERQSLHRRPGQLSVYTGAASPRPPIRARQRRRSSALGVSPPARSSATVTTPASCRAAGQARTDRRAAQGLRPPRRLRDGAQRDQRDHHRRVPRRPAHRRAIGAIVAQTISKPLRRLAAAATAIAHGDLRQELPTQRRDEIGSLAQAFNTMSAQVAARIDGLSEKTQTLALEISNLSAFGATLAQTPDPHAELRRLADMIRAMLDADSGERLPRLRGPHDARGVQRRQALPGALAGRRRARRLGGGRAARPRGARTPRPTST